MRDALVTVESKIRELRAKFDEFHGTHKVRPCGCDTPDCPVFMIEPSAAQVMDTLRNDILDAFRSVHPAFKVSVGY